MSKGEKEEEREREREGWGEGRREGGKYIGSEGVRK